MAEPRSIEYTALEPRLERAYDFAAALAAADQPKRRGLTYGYGYPTKPKHGKIIDSLLHGLASPLEHVPGAVSALLMIPFHNLVHVAVPSVTVYANVGSAAP